MRACGRLQLHRPHVVAEVVEVLDALQLVRGARVRQEVPLPVHDHRLGLDVHHLGLRVAGVPEVGVRVPSLTRRRPRAHLHQAHQLSPDLGARRLSRYLRNRRSASRSRCRSRPSTRRRRRRRSNLRGSTRPSAVCAAMLGRTAIEALPIRRRKLPVRKGARCPLSAPARALEEGAELLRTSLGRVLVGLTLAALVVLPLGVALSTLGVAFTSLWVPLGLPLQTSLYRELRRRVVLLRRRIGELPRLRAEIAPQLVNLRLVSHSTAETTSHEEAEVAVLHLLVGLQHLVRDRLQRRQLLAGVGGRDA
eukprot:9132926-Pyramimonas_sp.AAC.1